MENRVQGVEGVAQGPWWRVAGLSYLLEMPSQADLERRKGVKASPRDLNDQNQRPCQKMRCHLRFQHWDDSGPGQHRHMPPVTPMG